MMNTLLNLIRRIAPVFMGLTFSACTTIFYAPTGQNVPLLKEKGEVKVYGGLAATEYLTGGDLQAAYALDENIGLLASGTYLSPGANLGYGYHTEMAAGYFRSLGQWAIAEIYGGSGFAKITQGQPDDQFSVYFLKPFIQPALGFNLNYFEIAISSKFAAIHYNEPLVLDYELMRDPNGNPILDQNGSFRFRPIGQQQTFFAYEPALTVRAGWKYIKFQIQLSGSVQNIPDSEKMNISAGLSFNLAQRFKKTIP